MVAVDLADAVRRAGWPAAAWRKKSAARASSPATSTSVTNDWGASSSTPGSKTTKKLVSKRAQSTRRMLAMRVSMRTPWTSHVMRSPRPTSRSRARSSSMEMRGSDPAARGASHHSPETSSSEPESAAR